MENKEELIQLIESSFEDQFLSKAEKKRIKQLLLDSKPDRRFRDILRSEFFKIAQEKASKDNYQQVIQWVESMNKLIISSITQNKENDRVYFSPGIDCLNAILHQINKTQHVMRICLFTISDNRITDQIIKKHKRGVKVKIITDNDKIFDRGSDVQELFNAGIPVKIDNTDNHMHHKFALFDRKTTLTGSYNWTRSAERYNNENILLTQSVSIHQNFENEFKRLWDELVYFDKA